MAACTEPEEPGSRSLSAGLFERGRKSRSGRELTVELVFRPLAHLVVVVLAPLRVSPPLVVAANAAAGFLAAVALAGGQLVGAALLLQLKTVLDNADGQLARATGRTSVFGRYLDTAADLAVNVAVFAALGYQAGAPLLALAAFVSLTLVLSAAFNEDVLYCRSRGETVETEPPAAGAPGRVLAAVYRLVFAPGDRVLQAIVRRRLERILAGVDDPEPSERAVSVYFDDVTAVVLANMGLSTQLAVLGVCLALGVPTVYLWLAVACAAALPLLQLRREIAARRAIALL